MFTWQGHNAWPITLPQPRYLFSGALFGVVPAGTSTARSAPMGLRVRPTGLSRYTIFSLRFLHALKTYICLLGTHFAETSMLLVMAGILSRFNISLPPSTGGSSTAQPEISFTTGITRYVFHSMPEFMPLIIFYDSHIVPFDIRIIPRPTA